MAKMYDELVRIVGEESVLVNEMMDRHITFRAGGACEFFVSPSSVEEIKALINCCNTHGKEWYLIGNGSNLLVSDKGYPGVMIHLGNRYSGYEIEGNCVKVLAGTSLGALVRAVSKAGLGDMTWAAGIPGSVGGACVMNAGAYGGEMVQVLKNVTWLDEEGNVRVTDVSDLQLGYRQSIFKDSKKVVLAAEFELTPMPVEDLFAKMEELNKARKEKQPLEYPSAGSTFKRPVGYFAGKLIQDSDLRGYQIGGAQVSEKHCGFVINRDQATASELYDLFCHVRRTVQERFGVTLELEVELLGEFTESSGQEEA